MIAHRLAQAAAAAALAMALFAPAGAEAAQARYATTCFFQSRGFPPRDAQSCEVRETTNPTQTTISVRLTDGTTYAERIAIAPGGRGKVPERSSLTNLRSGFGARQAGQFTCAGVKASADQICFDIAKPDIIGWPG